MDYWTALLLGMMGSLHCAGMCGPLALALPLTGRGTRSLVAGRMAYNLGRIVTYTALGAVFGLLGKTLFLAGLQRGLSIGLGMLLFAGLLVSRRMALWRPLTRLVENLKSRMSFLLRQRSLLSLGGLGLLNGLLPCGLVYVAAAGATATGNLLAGATYMAIFGAGTVPTMLAIGLSGKLIPLSFRLRLRSAIPISVVLLATLLVLRGLSLGIPYVSPDAGASCCHK